MLSHRSKNTSGKSCHIALASKSTYKTAAASYCLQAAATGRGEEGRSKTNSTDTVLISTVTWLLSPPPPHPFLSQCSGLVLHSVQFPWSEQDSVRDTVDYRDTTELVEPLKRVERGLEINYGDNKTG